MKWAASLVAISVVLVVLTDAGHTSLYMFSLSPIFSRFLTLGKSAHYCVPRGVHANPGVHVGKCATGVNLGKSHDLLCIPFGNDVTNLYVLQDRIGREAVRSHSQPEPEHHGIADDCISAADEQPLTVKVRVGLASATLIFPMNNCSSAVPRCYGLGLWLPPHDFQR